jgi:site-specific recombinase XerD
MPQHTWKAAERAWLSAAGRRSVHTERTYRRAIERFKQFVNKPLAQVGGADCQAWADALSQDVAASTVNTYMSAVSSFYEYCIHKYTVRSNGREHGLTDYNPTTRVDREPVQKYGRARALTLEEAQRLLAQPDRETEIGLRDYAIMLMALLTGRRNTEIRRLTWGDVHNGQRYHWQGKRKKERTDELPAPCWAAIVNYQRAAGLDPDPSHPVFTAQRYDTKPLSSQFLNQMIQEYAAQAGIGHVTFHTLRHTYAYLRREQGHDLLDISRALAHSNIATTQIYLDQIATTDSGWQDVYGALIDCESSSEQRPQIPVLNMQGAAGRRVERNAGGRGANGGNGRGNGRDFQ